ncbi:hypothetical protein BD413DRAFT_618122 [Trametes elegans]|nr:hypothetical protein BD413DRAFT_618122 [Trametes elegans]
MSVGLLWWPSKPHVLSDDLESAYHILNWCGLKYLQHELTDDSTPATIYNYVHSTYDQHTPDGKCSIEKYRTIKDGGKFVEFPEDQPLAMLLQDLADAFKRFYGGKFRLELRTMYQACNWSNYPFGAAAGPAQRALSNHKLVLDVFDRTLRKTEWPPIKKTADQVPDPIPSSSVAYNVTAWTWCLGHFKAFLAQRSRYNLLLILAIVPAKARQSVTLLYRWRVVQQGLCREIRVTPQVLPPKGLRPPATRG